MLLERCCSPIALVAEPKAARCGGDSCPARTETPPCSLGAELEVKARFPAGLGKSTSGVGGHVLDRRGAALGLAGRSGAPVFCPPVSGRQSRAPQRGAEAEWGRAWRAGDPFAAGPDPDAALCPGPRWCRDSEGAETAKVPAPTRAPGAPVAEPGLIQKLTRKKKKRRFWKDKARDVSESAASGPKGELRPPKAPEDFSKNWKALQELLKEKSQAPEKPPVTSQVDSRKQPQTTQQNGKAKRAETGTGETAQVAAVGSTPPRSLASWRVPARSAKGSVAEHGDRGAERRTPGSISPKRGDVRHNKRKAEAMTAAPPTELNIWFDDVDPADIEVAIGPEAAQIARKQWGQLGGGMALEKEQAFGGLTRALAMDCEMVGVGPEGAESVAARVSLVNRYGKCVYDKYVKPAQPVTDYRTAVSGIRLEHLQQGEELEVVQKEVSEMLRGRILVGHALHNDLKVLLLNHPRKKIRDTQKYKPFRSRVQSGRPSLKLLAERILGARVQQAEHCSIQDAQVAMRLYITVRKEWERVTQGGRPAASAPDGHQDAVDPNTPPHGSLCIQKHLRPNRGPDHLSPERQQGPGAASENSLFC